MLNDSPSPPLAVPPRLRRDKRFAACAVESDEEFYANGIFEFNITRLLAFLDADRVRHPVEFIAAASIPDYGGERLDEATIRGADLKRPVLLAEISPGRFNLIDGNHRMARARREGVVSIPARRIRCPDHLPFLTSVRAYESYVEYWNGKVKELQPRQRRRSQAIAGRVNRTAQVQLGILPNNSLLHFSSSPGPVDNPVYNPSRVTQTTSTIRGLCSPGEKLTSRRREVRYAS